MLYFGKKKDITAYFLVSLQFICLFLIAATGPLYPERPVLLLVYFSGMTIGLWGILSMNSDTLNVPPNVRPNAELTSRGPYAVIRHPMYLALILVSLPLVIVKPTVFRIIVETTLAVDLLIKMHTEEKMLLKNLEGYQLYRKKTWKLIPFIY